MDARDVAAARKNRVVLPSELCSTGLLNALIEVPLCPFIIFARSRIKFHYVAVIRATILHRIQVIIQFMPACKDPLLRQSVDDVKHFFNMGLKIHQNDLAALQFHRLIDFKDHLQPRGVDVINLFHVEHDNFRFRLINLLYLI